MPKPRIVPTRLTVRELEEKEGMSLQEMAEQAMMWGIVPAVCRHHCDVEPDGQCEHGNPSVLIVAGLI